MKRFLFIGTSHLIAFKSAWKTLKLNDSHEALFIGMSGPQLVFSLELGWIASGNFILPNEKVKYYSEFMSAPPQELAYKSDNIPIDFTPDVIIFQDMQFWYQVIERLKIDHHKIIFYDGIPISDSCFSEMEIEGLGYRGLSNHHRFGDIPIQSVFPLLFALRNKYPLALMRCYAAPLTPTTNIESKGIVIEQSSLDLFETLSAQLLDKYNCKFIPQNRATISPFLGTKNEYSIGSLDGETKLNRHCTLDFGILHLVDMLRDLGLNQ
jgi:hypothetical protein